MARELPSMGGISFHHLERRYEEPSHYRQDWVGVTVALAKTRGCREEGLQVPAAREELASKLKESHNADLAQA